MGLIFTSLDVMCIFVGRHEQNVQVFFPSLKLTFFHLKMDVLEEDPFLLGWPIFQGQTVSFNNLQILREVVPPRNLQTW